MASKRGGTQPLFLNVARFEQPDDVTCGPACLKQVYRYLGADKPLSEIIAETPRNPDGGTLAVDMGIAALRNGFSATLYPYGFRVFDPTWRSFNPPQLIDRLRRRSAVVKSRKLRRAVRSYITYLELGGRMHFRELGRDLLVRILRSGRPILTGLSATYLYRTAREFAEREDDIRGEPVGHFVVICGYDPRTDRFIIRDPSSHIPFSRTGKYSVRTERLVSAILLGEVTFDAVLLVLGRR